MSKKSKSEPKAAPELVYKADDIAAEPPKKRGRGAQSTFTMELAELICSKIATGHSLFKIVNEHEELPEMTTVFRWLNRYPEFRVMYTQAREQQQHYIVDQMIALADDQSIPSDQKRLMIDARKWLASKLAPHTFGDKSITEHHGPGGGPMQVNTTVIDAKDLDPEQRAALKQALLTAKAK